MTDIPPLAVAVVYDGMNLFELGVASEIFGVPRPDLARAPYRLKMAAAEPGALRASAGLRLQVDGGLALLRRADIVVVPGWRDVSAAPPEPLLHALRRAHARGARVVSFCAGSFVLAAAGLLDGRRATTHWRYADAFRERFPAVCLEPDVLYVDEGDLLTSAGSAAAIDLGLHLVRRDHGAAVANTIARAMVSTPHRDGGQAQFVERPLALRGLRSLGPLMEWARRNLDASLTVSALARRAAMSERTLLRHFLDEAGMAPAQWLIRERVGVAQRLLESSPAALDDVAAASGFRSPEAFRAAFRRVLGLAPSAYRRRFEAAGPRGRA